MTPEECAKLFHDIYEHLAPHFGYETRRESAVAWENVPENNKALMVAVAAKILQEINAEREKETEKLRVTWFAGGRWVETHHQFSSDTQTQEEGFVAFLKELEQEK